MQEPETIIEHEPLDVTGKTYKPLPENIMAIASHAVDLHGNAGVGLVCKIGTCSECGRDNKIVGPKDFPPETRTCFGGCASQKGLTQWERKLAKMGWDPKGSMFDVEALHELEAKLAEMEAGLAASQQETDE